MARRVCAFVLMIRAGVIVALLLRFGHTDVRAATVGGAVALGGLVLNLYSLAATRLRVRPYLRGLAIAVALIVAVGALATRRVLLHELLDEIPAADLSLRERFVFAGQNLAWIAGTLVYLAASIACLPPPAARIDVTRTARDAGQPDGD
jgi:hypothetical protein